MKVWKPTSNHPSDQLANQANSPNQSNKNNNIKQIHTLVLSGGGILGISYLGAIKELETRTDLASIKNLVGTSVGSLIVALIAIGYTGQEMIDNLKEVNLLDLQHIELKALSNGYGFDRGHKLIDFLKRKIWQKTLNNDITFIELWNWKKIHLIITGTEINRSSIHYFDYINDPNMRIIDAIRISISIPIIYTSPIYKECHYVDGGILDDFPIHLFPNKTDQGILGIKLESKWNIINNEIDINSNVNANANVNANTINNFRDFVINMINCIMNNLRKLQEYKYRSRPHQIINIYEDITPIDFGIDKERIEKLIKLGSDSVRVWYSKIEIKNSIQKTFLEKKFT